MLKEPRSFLHRLSRGQRFQVHFDRLARFAHPNGSYRGHRVIPSYHTYDVQVGEVWEVEVLSWFESGHAKSYENRSPEIGWGSVIYVWPVRRVE